MDIKNSIGKLFYFFVLIQVTLSVHAEPSLPLHLLTLPPGFSISIYASSIDNPREMALGDKGTVFVGSNTAGNVYAITQDPSSNLTRIIKIATHLHKPNGVAFYRGALYVAEVSRILRYDNIENRLNNPPSPVVVYNSLPTEEHHGLRYIHFGPDNKLYIGIGAPCNVCLSNNRIFATIARMDPDGKNVEIVAEGVRNTVGFNWHPTTKQLWFTDNGRDLMGDDIPPDELNIAPSKGLHFGFPYCHGKNISDPIFGKKYPCDKFIPPVLELPAHVAALGMLFYQGHLFPATYQHQLFIAEHGSWNRSQKIGYQVILVTLDKNNNNKVTRVTPFVSGWLHEGKSWGRPVDLLTLSDGSLLISDDYADVIYRVTYNAT